MKYSVKQILMVICLILGFYHLRQTNMSWQNFASDMAAMVYFGILSIIESIELKKVP